MTTPGAKTTSPIQQDFASIEKDASLFKSHKQKPSLGIHPLAQKPSRPGSAAGTATTTDFESDTDTATDSSDEFNWDDAESAEEEKKVAGAKAKRGRRLWLLFLKLARPVRYVNHIVISADPDFLRSLGRFWPPSFSVAFLLHPHSFSSLYSPITSLVPTLYHGLSGSPLVGQSDVSSL
jgi:hypothetical protein